MKRQPVLLVILDGWGLRDDTRANAIAEAHPGFYEKLVREYPMVALDASGEAVGLPNRQMGNSEVGHMNMGAGRVVYQEMTRINKAIREGEFFRNEALINGMQHAKTRQSTLHLMGLVSDGGVHSAMNHLVALLEMARQQGVEKVRVHAFLDGRDVPPKSAAKYLLEVEQKLDALDFHQIATISGRYYAMDRDKRWERVEKAYHNLVMATGRRSLFSEDALLLAYKQGETDEFVTPAVCDMTYEGMQDGDSIIFFNFRPDRARELTQAFIDRDFHGFERQKVLKDFSFVCMTTYDVNFDVAVAFPKQNLDRTLAQILSENGIRQFHTAETEKYAHVTYFFNGGREAVFPGEDRKMIASPQVATYDLQPEMSLPGVTDAVVEALKSGQYQFIITNFANPDMVGHTGVMEAAVKAVKAVDEGLQKIITSALERDWVVLLTSDHGNIEQMKDEQGEPHTAHTTNLVPLFLVSNRRDLTLKDKGKVYALSNIAPTILEIMELPVPPEMTAESLLVRQPSQVAG